MKVSVRDLEVLRHLEPDVIREYRQTRRWQEHQAVHNTSLSTLNGASTPVSEILAVRSEPHRFPTRMYDLLETLEGVEERCLRHSKDDRNSISFTTF